MNGVYVIRPMSRDEFDVVVEWAAAEGWDPGDHDADAFYATDSGGFFLGLLDGDPIGSISVVRYDPEYSFLGYFIVKPEHRGKKYGLRLWQHAIDQLGTTAGLDGVLAQTANYARSGFQLAYHNQRYRGAARPAGAAHAQIVPYEASDLDAVVAYDGAIFPAERGVFLEHWLTQPGAHALLLKDDGAIGGYGMIRPSRDGYRIGPLFASDAGHAEALFDALCARVPVGSPVSMDVPAPNKAALDLVTRRNMTPVFETARMYRGPAPEVNLDAVFGVTSLELG